MGKTPRAPRGKTSGREEKRAIFGIRGGGRLLLPSRLFKMINETSRGVFGAFERSIIYKGKTAFADGGC